MLKNLVILNFLFIVLAAYIPVSGQAINGNGNIVKREQAVGDIVSITLKSSSDIILVAPSNNKIIIEADEKFMPFIECVVTDGDLIVRNKNEAWFNLTSPIKIYVPATRTLTEIVNNGSGNITTDNSFIYDHNSLKIRSKGSGRVVLNLKCNNLIINKSGSSRITLKGLATKVEIDAEGSGNILATDLSAETIDVKLRGSGNARLRCTASVHADIRGSSSLYVAGNPQIIQAKNSSNRIYHIKK